MATGPASASRSKSRTNSLSALESGAFAKDDLGRLGAAFRADLLARGGPEALAKAVALMKRMCIDRERVLATQVSSETELAELHRATFRGSLDLMLIAANSPLRASDVPELVEALGWCSAVRDLEDDLGHGLINLPRDVVQAAQAESADAKPSAWLATRAVREWRVGERVRGRALLDQRRCAAGELHWSARRCAAAALRALDAAIRRDVKVQSLCV